MNVVQKDLFKKKGGGGSGKGVTLLDIEFQFAIMYVKKKKLCIFMPTYLEDTDYEICVHIKLHYVLPISTNAEYELNQNI